MGFLSWIFNGNEKKASELIEAYKIYHKCFKLVRIKMAVVNHVHEISFEKHDEYMLDKIFVNECAKNGVFDLYVDFKKRFSPDMPEINLKDLLIKVVNIPDAKNMIYSKEIKACYHACDCVLIDLYWEIKKIKPEWEFTDSK